jgi:hypothetical protein
MIRKLNLEKFGKFSGRTLELSPFTIITGPNEAGKTTVFDALFDNLCEGDKNALVFRRLKERYGKDRRSTVEWAPGAEQPRYDAYDFLDIFAIRGGQIHIDAEQDGAWFRAFKSALFTAGIDPAEMAEALNKEGREAKNNRRVKLLALAEEEAFSLKRSLEAEVQRRGEVLAGEENIRQLTAGVQELREAAADKEAELAEAQPKLEAAKAGAELDRARKALAFLRELEALEARAAELEHFKEGALGVYDALAAGVDKAKEELAQLKGQLAEKERGVDAAALSLEEASSKAAELRRQGEQAAVLKAEIEKFTAEAAKTVKKIVYWPLRLVIWGAGLALASGLFFWLKGAAGAIVALVVAVLSGAVGWFAAAKTVSGVIDQKQNAALLSRLTDLWRNNGLDAELVRRETVQGMLDALSSITGKYASAKETLLKSEAVVVQCGKDKGELLKKAESAEAARREAEGAAQKWLADNGARSRDEYAARTAERAKAVSDLAGRRETARAMAAGRGCQDSKELKFRLQDEAERLERTGAAQVAEAELKTLEAGFEKLREEAQGAKERLLRGEAELESVKKVAATKLEGIPENISRLSVELSAKEAEAAEIRLMLEGYKLAAAVFEKIAGNSAMKLNLLAGEVGGMVKTMLPDRTVEFKTFDIEGAAMKDARGELLPLGSLSAGTRDLFMFAARLALALKTRFGAGGLAQALLVLDEPFYTLDHARAGAALKLLGAFQKETNWQIILLTKDPAVRAAAESAVPATIVEL